MDGAKATINYAFTEIDCDSIDHSYSLHGRQGIIRISFVTEKDVFLLLIGGGNTVRA